MRQRERSGLSFTDIVNKLRNLSISFDFGRPDPHRARRQLISQYNRKPSIYEEEDPIKNCLLLPGRVTAFVSDLFQDHSTLEESIATDDRKVRSSSVGDGVDGAPRNVVCDNLDVSVYKVIQRAICYAGAGLGIVGIGMVTFFGIFTAAGAACTVVACNKVADQNCKVDVYDPSDSDAYYEGRAIISTPNNYQPGDMSSTSPMHIRPQYSPYLM
ncbi:putative integral membrane protein [Babesia bovis T2Bo]|uniref:Uncharacterized protein n=1 Tax=Babesia bovis TaxID=5865 RepID=A7AUE1_BABBO|nr:putative integral membrane protein [Babesia bovis T2Bo]EDO06552.1 putative integral membrane protein [Babesia bovis T2Bo]BAN64339.1 hypothetical protein [Babesia bovis]|eukprot:XP_001610120.1 hypothetical protein [Babesia bovis T2Bo]